MGLSEELDSDILRSIWIVSASTLIYSLMHIACNPLDYINDSCDSPMSSSISDNIFNSSEHMIQIRNDKFLTEGLFRVVLAFNLEPFHNWFYTHSLQHGSFYQFPGFQSASKSPVSPDLYERSEKYSNDSCA